MIAVAPPSLSSDPRPLRQCAYAGLAGEFIRVIEPETEADPAALLLTFLAHYGNAIGRCAYYPIGGTRHYANLFLVLVGRTASGRKGTGHRAISCQFRDTDPDWYPHKIQHGLSSGEGLIQSVRDPVWKRSAEEREGKTKEFRSLEDEGVDDKRLLVVEEEFGSVLKMCQREGNILSNMVRQAWDGADLQTMTRNPLRATAPHISIVGHTTRDDLLKYLSETEYANGFGNRFLWCAVKRSKSLPNGGLLNESVLGPLRQRLAEGISFGAQAGELRRDQEASDIWCTEYDRLSADRPGLFGCMVARAPAQVLRLSMIYALLDTSTTIRKEHLDAALEIWRYCEDSVRFIFGDRVGDPVADRILAALRDSQFGFARTAISELFHRNQQANSIERALELLNELGLAKKQTVVTGGRPAEHWFAAKQGAAGNGY